MGLATSVVRAVYLTLVKSDLEYQIQLLTQTKMGLISSTNDLLNVGTELDPESPEVKMLEQRRERLHLIEKQLDIQLGGYKSRLEMVQTELESVMKIVEKNTQTIFKYGGN